jgi:hypothetical protein
LGFCPLPPSSVIGNIPFLKLADISPDGFIANTHFLDNFFESYAALTRRPAGTLEGIPTVINTLTVSKVRSSTLVWSLCNGSRIIKSGWHSSQRGLSSLQKLRKTSFAGKG